MAIVPERKGRMAVSEYRTREAYDDHSLLEVKILTGRTHQIRLHMAFIKCPVVGDVVYGRKKRTLPVARQFLHATRLRLTLPGQPTPQNFEAPLPHDLEEILNTLRH
jgi:23S rRNA pseudouridine1911/1915/1917 synthase